MLFGTSNDWHFDRTCLERTGMLRHVGVWSRGVLQTTLASRCNNPKRYLQKSTVFVCIWTENPRSLGLGGNPVFKCFQYFSTTWKSCFFILSFWFCCVMGCFVVAVACCAVAIFYSYAFGPCWCATPLVCFGLWLYLRGSIHLKASAPPKAVFPLQMPQA